MSHKVSTLISYSLDSQDVWDMKGLLLCFEFDLSFTVYPLIFMIWTGPTAHAAHVRTFCIQLDGQFAYKLVLTGLRARALVGA